MSILYRVRSVVERCRHALSPTGEPVSHVAVIDMLAHNWHLGLTCFGGPPVHFQIFRRLYVEKYQWIDETTYQELFALCQALSGPASTKMLYAVNVLRYSTWTGLVAFLVWSLPMAIVAFGLALGVEQVGEQLPGPAYALLTGLNSATVGIIALAAYQLSQKAITDTASRVIVFLGGAAGMLYNALWYFPVLMACGGLVTTVLDLRMLQRMLGKLRPREDPEAPSVRSVELTADRDEEDRGSLRSRRPGHHSPSDRLSMDNTSQTSRNQVVTSSGMLTSSWKAGTVLLCTFLATFVAVMACRAALGGKNLGFDLFANLYLAGTIIFGGGPVVVPLLREYIVTPGWVSPRNFLLGLAITQAFPGPNFNFAVYLGALAISGTSIPMVGGAIIGFIGIFTPGIWLATSFMGFWSNIRKLQAVRACLRGVHAAAVGLVFTAVYRLFEQGYLDNEVQSGGSLGRDPWWVVIVATAFVGGLHFNLAPPLAIILGATMGLVQYGVAKA